MNGNGGRGHFALPSMLRATGAGSPKTLAGWLGRFVGWWIGMLVLFTLGRVAWSTSTWMLSWVSSWAGIALAP